MSSLTIADKMLKHYENLGKQRAEKNSAYWEETGNTPEDSFDVPEKGMTIWNPWMSDCGRFETDPYKEYGKPFVEWLFKPFYPETL